MLLLCLSTFHLRLKHSHACAVFRLAFSNGAGQALDGFMIQFNRNSFGLAPATQAVPLSSLPPGGSATVDVPLAQNAALLAPGAASALLQVHLMFVPHLVLDMRDMMCSVT